MAKSKPFTLRLSERTESWIEEEARRTKRSKGALLESLAEEAIRMRRFPGVVFRGPEHDRRAWVVGTALDVWEIVEAYKEIGLERLLEEGEIPERQVRLALRYYEEHPEEIDQAIAENRRPLEYWRERYPGLLIRASTPR